MADEISFDLRSYVRDTSFFKFRSDKETDRPLFSLFSMHPEYYPYSLNNGYLHDDDMHLQEIYGSFSPGDIKFHFGRQKYFTGTGYGWNPTDLFNPKNIFDPMYETEAIDSALISYSFGGENEISAFYSFGDKRDDEAYSETGDYQIRMKTRTDVLDLAIHYTEAKRNQTNYEGLLTGDVSSSEATIPVRWQLLAAGVSSRIGKVGVHAEGGHAWLSLDKETEQVDANIFSKDYSSFLVGVDYTFENELYLVLEYYQEGRGKTSPDEYSLNDRFAYLSNERSTIGRDNVLLGAKYPIADMTSVELYNIINANDPSVIVNPWLIWSTGVDFTVKFSARFPVGKEESSVGQMKPSAFAHIQLNF